MRNTSAVYDVDPHTGAVNWHLGGKRSTLAPGPGVEFGFQHDAEFAGPAPLRLFNDNSSGPQTRGLSSVQWIRSGPGRAPCDVGARPNPPGRPGRVRDGQRAGAAQRRHLRRLGHGPAHLGVLAHRPARLRRLASRGTYRAYLDPWTATPVGPPQLAITTGAFPAIHAIWNGATTVRRWRLLHGSDAQHLVPVLTVDWNGSGHCDARGRAGGRVLRGGRPRHDRHRDRSLSIWSRPTSIAGNRVDARCSPSRPVRTAIRLGVRRGRSGGNPLRTKPSRC